MDALIEAFTITPNLKNKNDSTSAKCNYGLIAMVTAMSKIIEL